MAEREGAGRAASLPVIAAHPLERRRVPLDDPTWLFEVKAEGIRVPRYTTSGRLDVEIPYSDCDNLFLKDCNPRPFKCGMKFA